MPLTPDELAADAVAVHRAGAFAVHVHPRKPNGVQSLEARACDAAVGAIRRAAPALLVGLSTAEAIDRDPFARAAAVRSWRQKPDFVSVNVSEPGWEGVARAALHAGIGVEAGLATTADARALVASPFVHQLERALVEVEAGAEEARAVAELIPAGVAQLWHGYDDRTWEVIDAGAAAGHDVRIGLEDTLVLPSGERAANNTELARTAIDRLRA